MNALAGLRGDSCTRLFHDSDPGVDVSHQVSVDPVDDAGIDNSDLTRDYLPPWDWEIIYKFLTWLPSWLSAFDSDNGPVQPPPPEFLTV